MPTHDKFAYTFDNLARVIDEFTAKVGLTKYALYVQDYGAPVGYRLAVAHPERITALVVQNGNAYDEGLDNEFWKPIKAYWKEPEQQGEARRPPQADHLRSDEVAVHVTGAKDPELVSPDGAAHDQFLLDRKGNDEIQLDLLPELRQQPAALSEVAGVFPQVPAAGPDRLGEERPDLPGRRRRAVQARPEDVGIPPARRRTLRPGDRRRCDRRADPGLPRQARGQEVRPGRLDVLRPSGDDRSRRPSRPTIVGAVPFDGKDPDSNAS